MPAPASLDHYRLRDDAWAVLFTSQNVTISVMQAAAEAGVAAVGYDSLAGQRLTIPALLDRWHQQSAPAAPRERPASRCRAEASHRNGNATGTIPSERHCLTIDLDHCGHRRR